MSLTTRLKEASDSIRQQREWCEAIGMRHDTLKRQVRDVESLRREAEAELHRREDVLHRLVAEAEAQMQLEFAAGKAEE